MRKGKIRGIREIGGYFSVFSAGFGTAIFQQNAFIKSDTNAYLLAYGLVSRLSVPANMADPHEKNHRPRLR
jgi:hypothetical protein